MSCARATKYRFGATTAGAGEANQPELALAVPSQQMTDIANNLVTTARQAVEIGALGVDINRWDDGVATGVSANLCEALARLGDDDSDIERHDIELTMTMAWDADEPVQPVLIRDLNTGVSRRKGPARVRSVAVRLDEPQYSEATEAHREGRMASIRVQAILEPRRVRVVSMLDWQVLKGANPGMVGWSDTW